MNLRPDATVTEIEIAVAAAIACDPILLRMMSRLREAQERGMDPAKFGRLLRLAIETAFISGVKASL